MLPLWINCFIGSTPHLVYTSPLCTGRAEWSAWPAEPEIAAVWPSAEKRSPALEREGQQAVGVGENSEWGWAGMKTNEQVDW